MSNEADVVTRIVELETRIAWQEKTIADLDELVRTYSDRVVALEREIRTMRESIGGPESGSHSEPPPHY